MTGSGHYSQIRKVLKNIEYFLLYFTICYTPVKLLERVTQYLDYTSVCSYLRANLLINVDQNLFTGNNHFLSSAYYVNQLFNIFYAFTIFTINCNYLIQIKITNLRLKQ